MSRRAGLALAVLAALVVTGCVPSAPEPTPAPAPSPAAAPPPVPALAGPAPAWDNWQDAPQTPGDWQYVALNDGLGTTRAQFSRGRALFVMTCVRVNGRVRLSRLGDFAEGGAPMIVRTEFGERALDTQSGLDLAYAEVPASDPFLEQIAFSKGRFAVELAGEPALYLPAFPEISRVIEDCRRGAL